MSYFDVSMDSVPSQAASSHRILHEQRLDHFEETNNKGSSDIDSASIQQTASKGNTARAQPAWTRDGRWEKRWRP
jgi:hypothetical protein